MAERKVSIVGISFGVINILVALAPPCAFIVGAAFFFGELDLLRMHIDQNAPNAKVEAIGAAVCSCFLSLLLILGAVGLFLGQEWGRWVSIGAAVLMMLSFCIHDFYQLAIIRPLVVDFLDRPPRQPFDFFFVQPKAPARPPEEIAGMKLGFQFRFFCWSCSNPVIMVYLFAMSVTLCVTAFFRKSPS